MPFRQLANDYFYKGYPNWFVYLPGSVTFNNDF